MARFAVESHGRPALERLLQAGTNAEAMAALGTSEDAFLTAWREAAARLSGDEAWGLHLAEALTHETFASLSASAGAAVTVARPWPEWRGGCGAGRTPWSTRCGARRRPRLASNGTSRTAAPT